MCFYFLKEPNYAESNTECSASEYLPDESTSEDSCASPLKKPAIASKQPAIAAKKPASAAKKPTSASKQPASAAKKPDSTSKKPDRT